MVYKAAFFKTILILQIFNMLYKVLISKISISENLRNFEKHFKLNNRKKLRIS